MKKIYITIIVLVCFIITNAQEIHFTQNMNTPSLINPGFTGMFKGDLRASIQYKDQWNSWNNAYKTYSLNLDMPIIKNLYKNGDLALGLNLYNDKAGSADFNTSLINISISNIISLDKNNKLSAGLNFGYSKKSISLNKLQWGNQYDPDFGYNSMINSNESNLLDNTFDFDFSAGALWNYYNDLNGFGLTIGGALYHINATNISFNETDIIDQSYRAIGHIESKIKLTNSTSFEPSFYYTSKGTEAEYITGALFKTSISTNSNIGACELIYGSYYRVNDAIAPMAGFNFNNYQLTLSYDVNISKLVTASGYKGGLEVGFRFITPNPKNKYKFTMGDKRI